MPVWWQARCTSSEAALHPCQTAVSHAIQIAMTITSQAPGPDTQCVTNGCRDSPPTPGGRAQRSTERLAQGCLVDEEGPGTTADGCPARQDWHRHHTFSWPGGPGYSTVMTASISAVPAEASGTFNSLCKVLCILQSLYLCSIGPMSSMLPCDGYTSRFKLQSQATLLLDLGSHTCLARHTAPYGTVSLCCGPFQVTPWCWPGQDTATQSFAHSIC